MKIKDFKGPFKGPLDDFKGPRGNTCNYWAHSVDRDDRGITMRRFVDRHSARHLIDMRAMFCLDISMRAMLR